MSFKEYLSENGFLLPDLLGPDEDRLFNYIADNLDECLVTEKSIQFRNQYNLLRSAKTYNASTIRYFADKYKRYLEEVS